MCDTERYIPADLRRAVLVEAGHRCAIPTCQRTPVDIHHIAPFSESRGHRFENLIALCPTCHAKCEPRGKEIDRKSLHQYKANLALLTHRYGDFERRVLTFFGVRRADFDSFNDGPYFVTEEWRLIDLFYLLEDGMLEIRPPCKCGCGDECDSCPRPQGPGKATFRFTEKGRNLVRMMRDGALIE